MRLRTDEPKMERKETEEEATTADEDEANFAVSTFKIKCFLGGFSRSLLKALG